MADIIYNTSCSCNGPWLLDREQLERLDELIEDNWAKLQEQQESDVKLEVDSQWKTRLDSYQKYYEKDELDKRIDSLRTEIEESVRKSYILGRKERRLTLILKDETKYIGNSFSEAFREPSIEKSKVTGFDYKIICGRIEYQVRLSSYGTLYVNISPPDVRASIDLFADLKRWAIGAQEPKWQQYLKKWGGLQWAFFVVILFFLLPVGVSNTYPKWPQLEQALEMAKSGVKVQDVNKAIETLLALQTNFGKAQATIHVAGWCMAFFIIGVITCVLLSIRPNVVIAIGNDEHKIKLWRRWLKFVSITVPVGLFSSVVWPYLLDWIKVWATK